MRKLSKAIILSKPRSGSELLVTSLNSHPMIRCESELITQFDRKYPDLFLEGPTDTVVMDAFFDSQRLLKDERVYIFKAMYNQISDRSWKYIKDNDIKIIHLQREDIVKRMVSWDLMRRKEEFGRDSSKAFEEVEKISVDVDVDWIVEMIKEEQEERERVDEMIESTGVDCLDIRYRDLIGKDGDEVTELLPGAVKVLLNFLGIAYPVLTTQLHKQNHRLVEKTAKNYDDLVNKLKEEGLWQN